MEKRGKMINLNTAQQMAINQFIQDNWDDFVRTAKDFMTVDEIEALAKKLEKFS